MSSDARAAEITAIAGHHAGREGALLPILHDIQSQFGAVDEAAVRTVAGLLNLSRAEVHGVVSFYHDFRAVPAPLPVLKLCRAEACQARGVEALVADAEALAAGRVTIEPIYCLGLCSVGPAALVNGAVHARLDVDGLAVLIAEAA
jgi:formate dehydrogenase subunit gamma